MKKAIENKAKPQEIGESVFDILYLVFVITIGIVFLAASNGNKTLTLYGIMALTLGIGDSFHLIPRIVSGFNKNKDKLLKPLGFGKMVTSITMTIMYVIMFIIWQALYPQLKLNGTITALVLAFAVLRIALCLFPQNEWFRKSTSNSADKWSIYRNLPFLGIGVIMMSLFLYSAMSITDGFSYMFVAIFLSFAFYIPVVLFAKKLPKVGMLMIPKTMAYMWIVYMGFSLI